ncbi:MAG TPA: PD-(D/E)XK nuclease family protein [Geothrix sp.]|nr:PD-(D/E)XK nuclease family protein [Geothrix sp.]
MSYAPFDGVLLNDVKPPVPGSVGMLLHLRIARREAKAHGWTQPGLDALKARAQACRELLAQGLGPAVVRGLQDHGLAMGSAKSPHSLASLLSHLAAYLQEVERAGYLEPDDALWRAVDLELKGERGLWIERTDEDGPLAAGLHDLLPARLRALACVPGLGGATFALATRKGDASSGLFGSPQPLVEWFLDGLEQHGASLPNELDLAEPEGWGSAPWTAALERLFEGPLELEPFADSLQRGLAEGPVDLLRQAVEQVCAWLDEGIEAKHITVIHPEPHQAGAFLAPILAAEGVALHVRGGLLPLMASEAWSPLFTLLVGVARLDPSAVSAGLRASRREDLRRWADQLTEADQDGPLAFQGSFMHLEERARTAAQHVWEELTALSATALTARFWADRLEALAGSLRLPVDPDDFFSPLGLIKESWGKEVWDFQEMLTALETFLDTARSSRVPRAAEGLRLISPETVLEEWSGSRATLLLDLSEGAWPGRPDENPDLDWNRKAAINRALLAKTATESGAAFPAALQRFWLPRSEHGDQIPRTFQREAYAFNKVLAMTRERLVALSPAQDASGRMKAQGPFWNALEGAGAWKPQAAAAHSELRWRWDGHDSDSRAEQRAVAAMARPEKETLSTPAPGFDRVAEVRAAWLKGRPSASPTALEGLARCPFRSLAERVWRLRSFDASSRLAMAVGTLAHHVLEAALAPYVGLKDWPSAFLEAMGVTALAGAEAVLPHLAAEWTKHQEEWLIGLGDAIPREQWPQAVLDLEALLPNLAAALLNDARAEAPTRHELTFLYPERKAETEKGKGPLLEGWTRTLLALEQDLGPVDLDLGNGRSLPVDGKVDRIERWNHAEGSSFLRVTDYKTSKKASLDHYAEEGAPFGSHLQTPLYMLIAEAAMPGSVATAALIPLREEEPAPFTDHLKRLAESGEEAAWRKVLLQNLGCFDARLETGDFPPTPGDHCQRCELGGLCGRPVDVTADGEGEED